jgi:hypothetical protein
LRKLSHLVPQLSYRLLDAADALWHHLAPPLDAKLHVLQVLQEGTDGAAAL